MFPKPKRTRDKKLLKSYVGKPCVVCSKTDGTVGHHIRTRGSGGGDVRDNVIALCIKCHHEIHMIGKDSFFIKYGMPKQ